MAFSVVEIGGGGGAVALKIVDLWQIDGVDEGEAGQRAGNDGQKQQHNERRAAGELAAAVRGNRQDLAAGPDKVDGFRRLWSGGSQAIQPRGHLCRWTGVEDALDQG